MVLYLHVCICPFFLSVVGRLYDVESSEERKGRRREEKMSALAESSPLLGEEKKGLL
jgi:hypothetical protein